MVLAALVGVLGKSCQPEKSKQSMVVTDSTGTSHIYPTLAQIVKRSADQYYVDMLNSTWLKAFFKLMLKFLR